MNKIVSISMVKNEADIIESCARHALRFSDALIVCDHHSSDATRDILSKLQSEGLPVYIESYDGESYDQSEITTALMNRAISEFDADIIVPIDADEFIIADGGTSDDIRKLLGSLATDAIYYMDWIDYALIEPETETDKYLLSRGCKKNASPKNLPKIIIGRLAAERNNLIVQQGNHSVIPGDAAKNNGYDESMMKKIDAIHSAHFPYRTKNQESSKNLCMWLSNMAKFSPYSFYSQDYHQSFYDFLEEKTPDPHHLTNPTKSDISAYAEECRLLYTTGKVNPVRNALMMAESLAASYAMNKFRLANKKVSALMIWDGNEEAFTRSLESVLAQTYLPNEIFFIAFTNNNIDKLQLLKNNTEHLICKIKDYNRIYNNNVPVTIEIISDNIFEKLDNMVTGDYIQWVEPGSIIASEKIADMSLCLFAHEWCPMAIAKADISNFTYERGLFPGCMSLKSIHPADYYIGADLVREILATGLWPEFTLTSLMWRRDELKKLHFLRDSFMGANPLTFSLWVDAIPKGGEQIAYIDHAYNSNEVFVTNNEYMGSTTEFAMTLIEWGYTLLTNKNAEWMNKETYDRGAHSFKTRRRATLERISKSTPKDIVEELENIII